MDKVITIYEAKTNLSKLVKRAQAGETIYIGAYGQPQAVISPAPTKKPIVFGLLENEWKEGAYNDADIIGSDPEIVAAFEQSANEELL